MDGHLVQGHVDGIIKLLEKQDVEGGTKLKFSMPKSMSHLVAPKGSIAINGISLTINGLEDNFFEVLIVPHTLEHTSLKLCKPGDLLHVETDIIGRYLFEFSKNSLNRKDLK